jgi:hypothetical protein
LPPINGFGQGDHDHTQAVHRFGIVGRRQPLALSGCSEAPSADNYEPIAAAIRQPSDVEGLEGRALRQELVRCATLAPSSHNTQCWKFAWEDKGVTILPDLTRRCPVVDPDDHHVFVTLGCAAENLAHAALAHGLHADARFDATAMPF